MLVVFQIYTDQAPCAERYRWFWNIAGSDHLWHGSLVHAQRGWQNMKHVLWISLIEPFFGIFNGLAVVVVVVIGETVSHIFPGKGLDDYLVFKIILSKGHVECLDLCLEVGQLRGFPQSTISDRQNHHALGRGFLKAFPLHVSPLFVRGFGLGPSTLT